MASFVLLMNMYYAFKAKCATEIKSFHDGGKTFRCLHQKSNWRVRKKRQLDRDPRASPLLL